MLRPREWRGSVFKPSDKPNLWIKVRLGGAWKKRPTPYLPGQEAEAEEHLAEVRESILAREAAAGDGAAPLTVRSWGRVWLESRTASHDDDASILKNHVYPSPVGDMLLAEVQTRHVLALVQSWQPKDPHGNRLPDAPAPRTVRNWYSTLACMFRDAVLANLLPSSPCILRTPHLPSPEDADSEWRATARFTKAEVETLISPHPAIEPDSTVLYALLALADLRHGELAALRWRHLVEREPLDGLLVANSNARRRTKKGKTRLMPVHPTLAAVLAEWRAHGWAQIIGRPPREDDLILPLPLEWSQAGKPKGAARRTVRVMRERLKDLDGTRRRTKDHSWKRASRHLEELGWRHRRVHDLRRSFVSLATSDGADDRILHWGTHGRPGDIMGAYGDADWKRLCAEVLKLKLRRRGARHVVPFHQGPRLVPKTVPEGDGATTWGQEGPLTTRKHGRGRTPE